MIRELENLPRIKLANLPTPLEFCSGLSKKLGINIYFKRDDLTGSALSGNKIRKLEYLLADAKLNNATAVMTCGATTSNHARATSISARIVGLKSYLLLRKYEDDNRDYNNANLYLEQLVGAEIRYCSEEEYENRDTLMLEWSKELNEKVYIIDEGGSNEVGIIGYIEALREIREDCLSLSVKPDGIIVSVGTAGSYTGLLLGTSIYNWQIPIYGYSVCNTTEYFINEVHCITSLFNQKFKLDISILNENIHIIDASRGIPYGATTNTEWNLIKEFAENYGIILDPVYTVRAMNGFIDNIPTGKNFIFVHTGGIFGLLSKGQHVA